MKSGATNKKYTLPELVQIVERYEEKVNASAKTEVSLLSFMCAIFSYCKYTLSFMWIFSSWTLLVPASIYSKNRLLFYKKSLSEEFKVCLV